MKKVYYGIFVFIVIVIIGIGIVWSKKGSITSKNTIVYGAVGGGKENFLTDTDVLRILEEKYKIVLKYDDWSNNKLIKEPLEYSDKGKMKKYDFVFFSDERFYEYYKTPAIPGEAPREKVLKGEIALNTPIVIYSWDVICDALIKENIVTMKNDVYYITDMKKLIDYIVKGTKWADIGVSDIYGKINISSTDPITSSPGATYYGLLASIMNDGYVDETNISGVIPGLKDFYKLSGFMNNTPADLFDLYLRMGRGAYPLVVDYEKSMIDFSYQNPQGFSAVKDKMRILYPEPTIWNSHCIMSFTEAGTSYIDALKDQEIQNIAWERYGFRTGIAGGQYNVNAVEVKNIPQEIISVTGSLHKNIYDEIINELKNK